MEKYKLNRRLTNCKCDSCGKDFEKPTSEYKRNTNKGRKNYCSRTCSGRNNVKHLHSYPKYNISVHANNHVDKYTPFRAYLKKCKQRNREFSLTLEDIKTQWEKQKGICPYSGVSLLLYNHSNKEPIDIIYGASLDRIDSSKGYIKDNIQFTSIAINLMKSTMTHEKTIELCKIIKNNSSIL